MTKPKTKSAAEWTAQWMTSVAIGASTMSARKLTSIEKRGGGLKAVATAAKKQKVHLVLFEDDQGNPVVAASTKPFKVLA